MQSIISSICMYIFPVILTPLMLQASQNLAFGIYTQRSYVRQVFSTARKNERAHWIQNAGRTSVFVRWRLFEPPAQMLVKRTKSHPTNAVNNKRGRTDYRQNASVYFRNVTDPLSTRHKTWPTPHPTKTSPLLADYPSKIRRFFLGITSKLPRILGRLINERGI